MATKKIDPKPVPTPVVQPTPAEKLQAFLEKEKIEINSDALSNVEKIVSADGKRITGYIIREPQIKASDK